MLQASDTMGRPSKLDLLQGTLDLLVLRTLEGGPRHGWAIAERIQRASRDVLRVHQGSLYPALHRLEHQRWIKAEWGVSELGRRARFCGSGGARKRDSCERCRRKYEVSAVHWVSRTERKLRNSF